MKLTELDPRWIADDNRHGMGISFNCPLHKDCIRFGVMFENPVDGKEPRHNDGTHLWHREGDSFEDLTISPSIAVTYVEGDAITPLGMAGKEHWHGFVRNGEIIPA